MIVKLNLVWAREVFFCRVGAGDTLMRFAGGVKLRPRIVNPNTQRFEDNCSEGFC